MERTSADAAALRTARWQSIRIQMCVSPDYQPPERLRNHQDAEVVGEVVMIARPCEKDP